MTADDAGEGGADGLDDPFAELGGDDAVEDPFAELGDAFEEVDVGEVDDEAVWRQLEGDPSGRETDERDVTVVPKASYCEQCEHFSPPPEVRCSHEGTEILELVDVDSFRVVDCPVVARRREVGGRRLDERREEGRGRGADAVDELITDGE